VQIAECFEYRYEVFTHSETCSRLSLVKGSRFQPLAIDFLLARQASSGQTVDLLHAGRLRAALASAIVAVLLALVVFPEVVFLGGSLSPRASWLRSGSRWRSPRNAA
jgi:hypothetical protein